jgi:peroxiredoxin
MAHPKKRQKINLGQIIPLIIVGVGLIVIGLVLPKIFSNNTSSTEEYSVVPSAVNFPAPDLALNDTIGQPVSLADYHKKVVLVNNWATWCPPCKLEMPTLEKYYEEHVSQGFMLIGIEAGDTLSAVTSFVKEYKLTFPVLVDPNDDALVAFQNDSLPSSYVINPDGTVVLAWTGPISHAMLERYLTPLLEK